MKLTVQLSLTLHKKVGNNFSVFHSFASQCPSKSSNKAFVIDSWLIGCVIDLIGCVFVLLTCDRWLALSYDLTGLLYWLVIFEQRTIKDLGRRSAHMCTCTCDADLWLAHEVRRTISMAITIESLVNGQDYSQIFWKIYYQVFLDFIHWFTIKKWKLFPNFFF